MNDLPPESADVARLRAKLASLAERVTDLEREVEGMRLQLARVEQDNAPTIPRLEIPVFFE